MDGSAAGKLRLRLPPPALKFADWLTGRGRRGAEWVQGRVQYVVKGREGRDGVAAGEAAAKAGRGWQKI